MTGDDGRDGEGRRRRGNPRGASDASTYDVLFVQETLGAAGLYDGPIDGVAGAKTRLAVRRYKRRHGLPVDDTIDAEFTARVRDAL